MAPILVELIVLILSYVDNSTLCIKLGIFFFTDPFRPSKVTYRSKKWFTNHSSPNSHLGKVKKEEIFFMIFFWGSPALRMHFSLLQLFLCILDSDWQDAVINYALWFGPRFPQKLFFTKGLQMLSQPFCPLYTFIIYVHVLLAPEGALGRPMTN